MTKAKASSPFITFSAFMFCHSETFFSFPLSVFFPPAFGSFQPLQSQSSQSVRKGPFCRTLFGGFLINHFRYCCLLGYTGSYKYLEPLSSIKHSLLFFISLKNSGFFLFLAPLPLLWMKNKNEARAQDKHLFKSNFSIIRRCEVKRPLSPLHIKHPLLIVDG